MAKWWIGVAVVAIGLSTAPGAHAQFVSSAPPPQDPSAGYPSWMGCPGATPNPSGMPGLTKPGENAFKDETIVDNRNKCGWFADLGTRSLMRDNPGHLVIAVLDPGTGLPDSGNPPPQGSGVIQNLGKISEKWAWGPDFTLGYKWDKGAVELTGFYLLETTSTTKIASPGLVDGLFFNPPLGFEGDNGLWLQADRMKTTMRSAMWNVECNARWWTDELASLELITGVRYVNLQERLAIFTDDDGLTVVDVNGNPDLTREANYAMKTENQIAAPQLGLQWNTDVLRSLSLAFFVKGAWGVDFIKQEGFLQRGDGFVGFDDVRHRIEWSHLYEFGIFADWHLLDGVHLRVGYNAMWLLHVASAPDEVDFNLANTPGQQKNNSNIFYHGPKAELGVLF